MNSSIWSILITVISGVLTAFWPDFPVEAFYLCVTWLLTQLGVEIAITRKAKKKIGDKVKDW